MYMNDVSFNLYGHLRVGNRWTKWAEPRRDGALTVVQNFEFRSSEGLDFLSYAFLLVPHSHNGLFIHSNLTFI